jgi:hypothetical protein
VPRLTDNRSEISLGQRGDSKLVRGRLIIEVSCPSLERLRSSTYSDRTTSTGAGLSMLKSRPSCPRVELRMSYDRAARQKRDPAVETQVLQDAPQTASAAPLSHGRSSTKADILVLRCAALRWYALHPKPNEKRPAAPPLGMVFQPDINSVRRRSGTTAQGESRHVSRRTAHGSPSSERARILRFEVDVAPFD